MADDAFNAPETQPTARVFLSECRARRNGHDFWFDFRAAQRARMRASGSTPLPTTPVRPVQQDLFA